MQEPAHGGVEVFVGVDVAKGDHYACAVTATGGELAEQVASYRAIYNTIRPHEAIDMRRPLQRYQPAPTLPQLAI